MGSTMPNTRQTRKPIGGGSPRKTNDKENATFDVASTLRCNRNKLRSKSMGPGGLDALKVGSGNRRAVCLSTILLTMLPASTTKRANQIAIDQSLAVPSRPPPRSILKPTLPILPDIPPRGKGKGKKSDFTIDLNQLPGTKVALKSEEQQQAAAKEREKLEKEISDRREARRKSLANRRVSFAAEATLHTFHEIEYMQDSTSSTESTRRRSSIAPSQQEQSSDMPSTPPEQIEQQAEPPGDQRDLHQRKRRRSSMMSTGDDTLASAVYSSDSEHGDEVINEQIVEDEESDSSDAEDGTMVTVDDVTGTSVCSAQSVASNEDSTDNIDEALQLARRTARSNAALDGEEEDEEVVPGLAGWGKKIIQFKPSARSLDDAATRLQITKVKDEPTELTIDMDMEITKPLGGIIRSEARSDDADSNEDMSMDVTSAVGGILSQVKNQTERINLETASGDKHMMEDEPMEPTTVIGGMRDPSTKGDETQIGVKDEEISMELTTVMGRVLQSKKDATFQDQTVALCTSNDGDNDEDAPTGMTMEIPMNMTVGIGRILPNGSQKDEGEVEASMAMEMTMAVGSILSRPQEESPTTKHVELDGEPEEDNITNSSPFKVLQSPKQPGRTPLQDVESPGLSAFRGKGLRRSLPALRETTPPDTRTVEAAAAKPPTPQQAPKQGKSLSSKRTNRPSRSPSKSPRIFHTDANTGISTPHVVLTPRRVSGMGADRPGLDSPKVSAILDRRASIGDSASTFSPVQLGKRTVAFEDPRVIERQVDQERKEDEDREGRRKIIDCEADGSTVYNLKNMIESLSPSPRFKPLRGRKSLAIGSGAGLLGKRPVELEESEDEHGDGFKRLKGHQGSPVKNVHLQQPPSKAETTGRMTRASASKSQEVTSDIVTTTSLRISPVKASKAATPKGQGPFRDAEVEPAPIGIRFDEARQEVDEASVQSYPDEDIGERIHLQDFLNMTSIRFMELNTTKRRATAAPQSFNMSLGEQEENASLQRCVVAGACTVPQLELYQHSCRELKKYISEGRKIVREIESETFEVNPPLFREYMAATPELRVLMDNQFKNVKTHARLQSKAMWYEWRKKLQEGMKEGLQQTSTGMDADDKIINRQQTLLNSVLPALKHKHEALKKENSDLQAAADELADCDQEELQKARKELTTLDYEIGEKTKLIAKLRGELSSIETIVNTLKTQKSSCLSDIRDAERVREECRGWSTADVEAYRSRVEALEKKHGWAIVGVDGSNVRMTYKRKIELIFDAAAWGPNSQPGARREAEVKYYEPSSRLPDSPHDDTTREDVSLIEPVRGFFLDAINARVEGLPREGTIHKHLLGVVSGAWDTALLAMFNVRLLNTTHKTRVVRHGDGGKTIQITSQVLVRPVKTKVEVCFVVAAAASGSEQTFDVGVSSRAKVVYGEQFNEQKMGEFLGVRLAGHADDAAAAAEKVKEGERKEFFGQVGAAKITKDVLWVDVVGELHERLAARGKKVQGESQG